MAEVSNNRPDYLSLVNQSGSGFNVSELVDAMVNSDIQPKRFLQTEKLEKTENAISGIGYLNSQASKTKSNFELISKNEFYNISSSNSDGVSVNISDETKLSVGSRTVSNVVTAKKMIFELGGFADTGGSLNGNLTIDFGTWSEVAGAYSFSSSGGGTHNLTFAGKTLNQVAAEFNSIDGISAEVIDVGGSVNRYSLILSSDTVGATNGFHISDSTAGQDRWETPNDPTSDSVDNKFNQLATNASFTLDGISISRNTNTISNVIDGAVIELHSDFVSAATLSFNRSEGAIRQTVSDVIVSLNEFKAEIERLTLIDIEGGNHGALIMDPSVTALKSDFKKLMLSPLMGYGPDPVYMSQLGIKTNTEGDFYFDENVFERTLSSSPHYFSALKDPKISTSQATITAKQSSYSPISSGNYVVSFDASSGKWQFADTALLEIDMGGGAYKYTSTSFPGLEINTTQPLVTSETFTVYVGQSISKKMSYLMESALSINSPTAAAESSYKDLRSKISERIEKLDVREQLLRDRYTEQFGAMESSMTQFNSTKSMLENFIEAWKKQK